MNILYFAINDSDLMTVGHGSQAIKLAQDVNTADFLIDDIAGKSISEPFQNHR